LLPYSTFVPDELMQLYTASNGLTIGDFRIVSLKEMMWPALDSVALHFWGNGDQDAARIVRGQHACDLIFFGHDPSWEFVVARSIGQWIDAVYSEWTRFGTVLDPWSCHVSQVDRLYTKHDVLQLRGDQGS
jgi:hypothetical protein